MTWRVLRRLIAVDVMQTLEYRGAFFLFMVGLMATPVISLLVWLAVSAHAHNLPFHRQQFVTYYLLLTVTSMITSVWLAPWLAETIRLGGLSPWLLRPSPYILNQIANNIGEKIVKLPLLLPLVTIMGFAFRADLCLPTDLASWLLFVICLPISASVAFLLDFTLGSLAFWVHDIRGLARVKYLLSTLLAGQLVPLALFPDKFRGFLQVQPFRFTLSFPLEVVTGGVSMRTLALSECANVLIGVGITVYAIQAAGVRLSIGGVLEAIVLLLCGVVLLYAVWFAIMTCSFWLVQVNNLDVLFFAVFEAARYPVGYFSGAVRALLTFVVPVAFATTFPVEALFGRVDVRLIPLGLALAGFSVLLTHLFWNVAVRSYSSASS